MHLRLITVTLLTCIFCGSFTSDKNNNAVSASSACDYKVNVVGLFEVIESLLRDEKKSSDTILNNIQDLANSLVAVKAALFKMQMKEARRCSIAALAPEERNFKNCAERKAQGDSVSGVRTVYPYGNSTDCNFDVFCDQTTDEGGWTVIQSRSPVPARENFTRSWSEYELGFGDLSGEFWLGLQKIHDLTSSTNMELRIDLEGAEGEKRHAKYAIFHVGDAATKYLLSIGNYSGNAGDGMTDPATERLNLNGMKFSTYDEDNDLAPGYNCAKDFNGGWWFNDCFAAHLNGLPIVGDHPNNDGITWSPFRVRYSLKKASMKIRPVSRGF